MALTCEARVKLTLSLGLIILLVSCAVITVVVLKATTDDPDLSLKYDYNGTNVTTNQTVPIYPTLKKITKQNGEAVEIQKSSVATKSQSKYISRTTEAIEIEEITFTGMYCMQAWPFDSMMIR